MNPSNSARLPERKIASWHFHALLSNTQPMAPVTKAKKLA
jgi:hypothetical protein